MSFFPLRSSLCSSVGQFIDYEDYDNTTGYYRANEYEYEEEEEEEERYGPAEREREFSLNTEVISKLSVIQEGEDCLLFIYICLPSLASTRERTERRAGLSGNGKKKHTRG